MFSFETDYGISKQISLLYELSLAVDRYCKPICNVDENSFKLTETILKGKTENPGRKKVDLKISKEELLFRYNELKSKGKGLRELAKQLKVSYETIRVRLKTMADNP